MGCTTFFYALLLASSLSTLHSFLVTRLKNPNEYVARDDFSALEDLDDNTYQYLLEELPELKEYLKNRRSNLELEEFNNDSNEFKSNQYYNEYEDNEEVSNGTLEEYDLEEYHKADNISSTTDKPKFPFITRWPNPLNATIEPNRTTKISRGLAWFSPYQGKRVARCYWCGLNQTGIPLNPLCHDMFDTQDFRARTLARFFRAHCHYNQYHGWAMKKRHWRSYRYAPGLINEYYGKFSGGCFKRFLDVGTVYTQRGCRSWWPRMSWHWVGIHATRSGRTFPSHRFAALERPYRYQKKDICIVSPHASLTPFHRSISLYVRYHVCLCFQKWCNRGVKFGMSTMFMLSHFTFMIIYYVVM